MLSEQWLCSPVLSPEYLIAGRVGKQSAGQRSSAGDPAVGGAGLDPAWGGPAPRGHGWAEEHTAPRGWEPRPSPLSGWVPAPVHPRAWRLLALPASLALLPEPSDLAEVSMYLARDGVS